MAHTDETSPDIAPDAGVPDRDGPKSPPDGPTLREGVLRQRRHIEELTGEDPLSSRDD